MCIPRSALVLLVALAPGIALAQQATTGVVTGRVVDSSGAVLPGVTVSLKSPEALGTFTGVTDAQGLYRVGSLPPATYAVTAELQGFERVVRQAIVRVNGVTEVDFALSVGSVAETVTVTGAVSTVDTERAGLSVNINNQALTSVPVTTNRRFQDVWLMVPDPGGMGQFAARRTSVDGMDVTNPDNGDINGVNLNYEAIQDVEIKALGAEASDGTSFVGQYMNVVTKSGGNDVHGSAVFAYIPQRFNGSNVTGVAPNQRTNIQPDFTVGGPIRRDKVWYFTAYRRLQEDVTQNNARVAAQNRGNLWFAKVTTQLNNNHRLQTTFQSDRTIQRNGALRSVVNFIPGAGRVFGSSSAGLSGATPQLADASAFGSLVSGGPLVGVNYNWVINSTRLFQLVGSWMQKVSTAQPNDGDPLGVTTVVQTNPAGNIAGSLTTISQSGSFGGVTDSVRSTIYLSPSVTFLVNKLGSHEFRGGADLYPRTHKAETTDQRAVEFYFRPPGTTGSQDILFERDGLRGLDGGTATNNRATVHYYAGYFQDRWKPTPRTSVKAGFRVEAISLVTADRQKVLGALLPPDLPINIADRELSYHQIFPNFGIALDYGKWGVFRGTMSRQYEYQDLGGQSNLSHPPYVLSTDVFRATPRTVAPVLNQTLVGAPPLGLDFGPSKDGSDTGPTRTYVNEFSGSWEHGLGSTGSFTTVFLWRRTWDVKTFIDLNNVRNPVTGALVGRPFPAYDAIRQEVQSPMWGQTRSLQFLYAKHFGGRWGINSNYVYVITTTARFKWLAESDTFQFLGISPDDALSQRATGRHRVRLSTFVRLPFDVQGSAYYSYQQGNRSNVMTGDFPLNAAASTVVLSNGRVVSDPFFNPAYPRARKNDVDMIKADDTHFVNLRIEKGFALPANRRISVSGDIFNLLNAAAASTFLSADVRSANFARPSGYQSARVGQLAVRFVF
jgi:hypothetical protein